MEEINDGFYGAILQSDPRDYKLGGTSIEIPKAFNTETFEYNQLEFAKEFGSNLCTLYSPIGMISNLIGKQLNEDERKHLCKLRTSMSDFDPKVGGYLVEGNNCVRRWWNESFPNNQIRQFSLDLGSDEFFEALDKAHRINIGYKGNRVYNSDVEDGVLDSVNIGTTTYGHSTCVEKRNNEYVVDNYFGVKKFNRYSFRDFKEFINSGLVYKTTYLYLFASDSMDAQIALLKEKWKDSGVTFNSEAIKKYAELNRKNNG